MLNKRKLFIPIILSSMLLTACGSGTTKNEAAVSDRSSYDTNAEYTEDMPSEEIDPENSNSSTDSEKEVNTSDEIIRKEMLVYSCNLIVDVLDFDTAIDNFRNSLDTYGAFVENENYNDGGSASRWLYENEESWKTYNATIRVPSEDYDEFCDYASNLGDLRKKDASVDNLSTEYYDLSTTLEIYKAKEARYIEMLATLDDSTAIAIEKELTDIQIEISRIMTRMNKIQTDVAYSYVHITINEVKEYVEEPEVVKTDTFGQRFKKTVKESVSGFLSVMETLLFIFIYLFPHLLVIGLFTGIIVAIVKAANKRRKAKFTTAMPAVPIQPPVEDNSENEAITENTEE